MPRGCPRPLTRTCARAGRARPPRAIPQVVSQGYEHYVALYSGMSTAELSCVLRSAFGFDTEVVGFEARAPRRWRARGPRARKRFAPERKLSV